MTLKSALPKVVRIGLFYRRGHYEEYVDPRTGRSPVFGSYQAAQRFIEDRELPIEASPVECFEEASAS